MIYIRVWERNGCVFFDLVNDKLSFEVKRFYKKNYHNLSSEVSFHLKRLEQVTGYTVQNETDLCV